MTGVVLEEEPKVKDLNGTVIETLVILARILPESGAWVKGLQLVSGQDPMEYDREKEKGDVGLGCTEKANIRARLREEWSF